MRDLKEQLNGLKDVERLYAPDKNWVEKNRVLLLSQIRNTVSVDQAPTLMDRLSQAIHVIVPQSAMRAMRPVMSVALILSLTVAGWITTASASNSLPGDLLWNVKLAQEKTESVITDIAASPKKQTEVHLKHAARRAQEIKQVTETPKPEAAKKIKIAAEQLKQSLESANKTVGEVQKTSPNEVIGVVKEFSAVTAEISTTLEATSSKLELSEDTKQSATETTRVVQKSGLEAIGLLMTGESATSGEAKALVEEKIGLVLGTVERASETQVRTLAAEEKSATSTPTASSTTPTAALTSVDTAITPPTTAVAPTVNPEAVRVLSQEIKTLMETDKLTEALEKTKELVTLQGSTTAPAPVPTTATTTTSDVSVQTAPTSSLQSSTTTAPTTTKE